MSDMANAIMDAAERRIREGGYGAFSFREIAADVGVKSSSVHYHFPTKEDLAAAVVHRYVDTSVENFDAALKKNPDPVKVWSELLGGTVHTKGMCPGALLGATSKDLPPKVALEVKRFFHMHLDKLTEAGMPSAEAAEFFSTLIGAMVVANGIGDASVYDRATAQYLSHTQAAA